MSKKINTLIKNYLLTHGEVIVPGLGRIKEEYISSSLHVVSKNISPSTCQYSFDDSFFSDSGFIDYVCGMLHISKKKAEEKIRAFSEQVLNRLLNYRMAKLSGIGELKQNEDRTIQFIPDPTLQAGSSTLLPTLQLNPVIRQNSSKEEIILSKLESNKSYAEDFKPTSKNSLAQRHYIDQSITSSGWRDYLLCAILIAAIILLISQCSQLYKQNELRNRTYPVSGISDTVVQSVDPMTQKGTSFDGEEDERTEPANEVSNTKTQTEEALVYNYNLSEDIIKEGCIIVVGSYKSSNNAEAMLTRIRRDGHKVFKEPNNIGYTRVGLYIDCNNDSDLPSILRDIRNSYSDSSWYLSPELDVEY